MKDELCQFRVEWVIINGVALRLLTSKIHPIPKSWASFIVKKLESTSNLLEFIVKRCMALTSIMNHEPINVGKLIIKNIKYMVDAPQRAYGYICIVNMLCRLDGV